MTNQSTSPIHSHFASCKYDVTLCSDAEWFLRASLPEVTWQRTLTVNSSAAEKSRIESTDRPFPSAIHVLHCSNRLRAPAVRRKRIESALGDFGDEITRDVVTGSAAFDRHYGSWTPRKFCRLEQKVVWAQDRRRVREGGNSGRRCFNIATWTMYWVSRWTVAVDVRASLDTLSENELQTPVSLGRRSVDDRGSALACSA